MISEISSLPYKDLEGLKVPTALCYVLRLTSFSGFESHSLRHAVWTAEKLRSLHAEIREICPYFAILPRQTGRQRTDCSAENGALSRFFSAGHMRSPVLRRA